MKDQGVNNPLALLSQSKGPALCRVGRCYGSAMPWVVCTVQSVVNGCTETNDRYFHTVPSQIPQGFDGASDNC